MSVGLKSPSVHTNRLGRSSRYSTTRLHRSFGSRVKRNKQLIQLVDSVNLDGCITPLDRDLDNRARSERWMMIRGEWNVISKVEFNQTPHSYTVTIEQCQTLELWMLLSHHNHLVGGKGGVSPPWRQPFQSWDVETDGTHRCYANELISANETTMRFGIHILARRRG